MEQETLGVLCTGTMGTGIVQLGAQSCYRVIACDASVEALERTQVYVREGLWRFAEKSAFSEDEAVSHYKRLHWTTNIEKLSDAPAVIEVIFEKVEPLKEFLAALDDLLPPDSLIFTNPSAPSVSETRPTAWWRRPASRTLSRP